VETVLEMVTGRFTGHTVFQEAIGYKNRFSGSDMIPVGSDLSIIQWENRYLYYANSFPYETYDYSAQALQLRKVQYAVQSRRVLAESDLPPSQYRYKTEPHWTTQAAFEVYLSLLEWMGRQPDSSYDFAFYTERNNYNQTMYEESFSGQLGQLVGIPYAGYNDFMLIQPCFETSFTLDYSKLSLLPQVQGDFASVLLEQHWMNTDNPYERNLYSMYLTSVDSFRQILNDSNPNGPKVLLTGDTYMLPVATFLATAASDLCLLWPYSVPDMDKDADNLVEYIERNDFDYVVIGMSPGSLYGGAFNFLEGIDTTALGALN